MIAVIPDGWAIAFVGPLLVFAASWTAYITKQILRLSEILARLEARLNTKDAEHDNLVQRTQRLEDHIFNSR